MTGGVDKVVNAAGLGSVNQAMAATKAGGEVVTMGLFTMGDALDPMQLMAKALSLRGTAVGSKAELEALTAFVGQTGVLPPIAARFAFEDAKQAYRKLAAGNAFGKIVIAVGRG